MEAMTGGAVVEKDAWVCVCVCVCVSATHTTHLCQVKLIVVPAVVLAFVIVASGNDDVHGDHAQDEHVEHRGAHQLLWKQGAPSNQNQCRLSTACKEEVGVHHKLTTVVIGLTFAYLLWGSFCYGLSFFSKLYQRFQRSVFSE